MLLKLYAERRFRKFALRSLIIQIISQHFLRSVTDCSQYFATIRYRSQFANIS